MEKFDKKKLIELGLKYYGLKDKFREQDEFERENITGTIYEEYFDGENLERSEVVDRILKGYKKIKHYDLESIFLLGVAQNNTERNKWSIIRTNRKSSYRKCFGKSI